MNFRVAFLGLALTLTVTGFADTSHVTNANGNISIDVEGMKTSELLRLLDQATGMHSKIPPALANHTITIQFEGLPIDKAVEKIFAKLEFDYVFVSGQGVVVTGASQSASVEPPIAPETSPDIVIEPEPTKTSREKPAIEPLLPPLVATPFGPIPYNGNPVTYLPPIPTAAPPIPFFAPQLPAPNAPPPWSGPIPENMFRPISIYQDPIVLSPRP
jgi:hypothetical protein